MKRLLLTGSLILAAATMSFAGNPKETKEANAETPTEAKSTSGQTLVWYIVSYDNPGTYPNGYVKAGTSPSYTGERSGAEALGVCELGSTVDCLRGFSSAPSLPTDNTGIDQIETDETH